MSSHSLYTLAQATYQAAQNIRFVELHYGEKSGAEARVAYDEALTAALGSLGAAMTAPHGSVEREAALLRAAVQVGGFDNHALDQRAAPAAIEAGLRAVLGRGFIEGLGGPAHQLHTQATGSLRRELRDQFEAGRQRQLHRARFGPAGPATITRAS